MQRAVQRADLPLVFPDAQPGVYRELIPLMGGVFYYYIGQGGVLLDIRMVRVDETEAEVAVAVRRSGRRDRPRLTLHSPSPVADASPSPVPSPPAPRLGLVPPR